MRASTNSSVNSRSADKSLSSGETYDTATHSPTAVKPVHAREDVEDIFSGNELSEDLKDRAATVYEAAVNSRITIVESIINSSIDNKDKKINDLVLEEYKMKKLITFTFVIISTFLHQGRLFSWPSMIHAL